VLIELVSNLARSVSLGLRLFANLVAGHTLMAILSSFLFKLFTSSILFSVLTLIPFAVFVGIIGLEIAVSFIQAYVFVLLTASYIKDAEYLH
jgi:F-type H+-transporting ATPase subunit a